MPRISFPYPGGKARLAKRLMGYFPKHGNLYLEPFAGRGNVFWQTQELDFKAWHLNDISTHAFFNALKTGTCEVVERTRENYYLLWERYKQGDHQATLLVPYITFSGGGYGSGGFGNLKGASEKGYKNILDAAHAYINKRNVTITALDWKDLHIDELSETDFVYLDPPYMNMDVRSYSNKFDHKGMVDTLLKAKCKWMLSEYANPLYIEAFGQPLTTFNSQLSVSNLSKVSATRIECIWGNYVS